MNPTVNNMRLSTTLLTILGVGIFLAIPQLADATDAALSGRCHETLDRALQEAQKWVKVHAAESLVAAGEGDKVVPVFKHELEASGNEPEYRIGIWRVLTQASSVPAEKDQYLQKIIAALRDPNGPDTTHAAETLGKLNYIISAGDRPRVEHLAATVTGKGLPFARWLLALTGNPDDVHKLADLLDHTDPEIRGTTAFSLRYLRDKLPPDVVEKLQRTADKEPSSEYRMHLLGTAYVTAKDSKLAARYHDQLLPYLSASTTPQRFAAICALAIRGDQADITRLTSMLDDPELDIRVIAAHAILEIQKRAPNGK